MIMKLFYLVIIERSIISHNSAYISGRNGRDTVCFYLFYVQNKELLPKGLMGFLVNQIYAVLICVGLPVISE